MTKEPPHPFFSPPPLLRSDNPPPPSPPLKSQSVPSRRPRSGNRLLPPYSVDLLRLCSGQISIRSLIGRVQKMGKSRGAKGGSTTSYMDFNGMKLDIKSIAKDFKSLEPLHTTWKERKDMENRKVVSLGGKPLKKERLPLSIARVQMKKQKEREQKMQQEGLIFGGNLAGSSIGSTKRLPEKRKPEDRVLKSTVGYFKHGVLNVKNMLQPSGTSRNGDNGNREVHRGKKKKGGKNNHRGKNKKKGGKNRH